MVSSEERQRVIEANRSLRNIKNELESLLEKGILSDDAFDSIQSLLPTESSISASGGRASAPQRTPGLPTPTATPTSPASPPSYAQSTTSGPPPLPGRNPPPAAPPSKPVLAHAKALYKYAASDARDCSLERGDAVAVYEYMNADWWMGKNLRTGQEGIFPKSYVEPEAAAAPAASPGGWNEKAPVGAYQGYQGYQGPPQPQYAPGPGNTYPAPPGQMNPYNAHAPPMAMANQGQGQGQEEGGSKVGETGKKFGKKLGNAAIFGAGATIGSNLVNSIF
ncbi:SH3 domain-containing protein [Lasiosphaeria hispida]|uniref:SH3 domain-containing protein n=1 Tax=Lasiosphaeria hispida TaxID=260671 RepID=A0AAJ0MK41_9PEZI|nr:SH3 domain-containing protein [Lasiosphaeria hispida]